VRGRCYSTLVKTLNCAYIGRELGLPTHPPEAQTSEPDEPGAADKSHAVE